ncbi:MAG TPA: choice-of-anchor B family protein, partial [bacterium]|nr:choice-of-anchor B family protein [bacterium]
VDSLGNEYAIVGCFNGTAIINVTNPTSPTEIAYIPAPSSSWHEVQVWDKYAYVVSEGGNGLQVIDLSQLPTSASLVQNWTTPNYFRTHALQVRNGYAYLTGGNVTQGVPGGKDIGGIKIVSLADPRNPVEVGNWAENYVHDCYVRNDTIYAASIYQGIIYVIDTKVKSKPRTIHQFTYPNAFSHNTALSDDGNYLFTTDETSSPAGRLRIWNISTLRDGIPNNTNISQVKDFGTTAIVHNVYVKGRYAYASYYTEGVRIWDLNNISTLPVAGAYDTYDADNSANFTGAWGVFPFFPSGNIAISDIVRGLIMISFSGKETGQISGTVKDVNTDLPLTGVKVALLEDTQTRLTNALGQYNFSALHGATTVKLRKPGYRTAYHYTTVPLNATSTYNFSLTPLTAKSPTSISAFADSALVDLVWNSPDPNDIVKYRIYYGMSPNPTTQMDSTIDSRDTTRSISTLTVGGTYYFRVKAVYWDGQVSDFSTETSALIPNKKPVATTILNILSDSAQATIRWRKSNDSDFLRYRIFGGTSPNPTTQIDSISAQNDTVKTITNLMNGQTYYFAVSVVDVDGLMSRLSNEVSVLVKPIVFNLVTALYQNSVLPQYINVVVNTNIALVSPPSVRFWKTNDTTSVSLSVLPGTANTYSGSYQLKQSGTYTIQTRGISFRNQDSTKLRYLTATLAKPSSDNRLTTEDGASVLMIPGSAVTTDMFFTCSIEKNEETERIYAFGPDINYTVPLQLQFKLPALTNEQSKKWFILREENGQWVKIESHVLANENIIRTNLSSLGRFKLQYDPTSGDETLIVKSFDLKQNFPNPFNPETTIAFTLENNSDRLTLTVYNTLGQKIKTLWDGPKTSGYHRVTWDGTNETGQRVSTGTYIYRVNTGKSVFTKKMLLIK